MPRQKQKLFSQEMELISSAVLHAAEMSTKGKKKAFLSNTCSSEEEWPLHTVPRLCPSPGQSHAGIKGDQQSRRGESDCICKSLGPFFSHQAIPIQSRAMLYLPFAGTWPTEGHKKKKKTKKKAGGLFSGDENCSSLISGSLPLLSISGGRLRKKNEAKTRGSFGTATSRALCEGTRRGAQCGCSSTPHRTRGSVRICRCLP